MNKEELLARLTDVKTRLQEIHNQYGVQLIARESDDGREFDALVAERKQLEEQIEQYEAREEYIREMADDARQEGGSLSPFQTARPGVTRGEDIWDLSTIRTSVTSPEGARTEMHDRAMRAVDIAHFPHPDADQAKCAEQLERILSHDATGDVAKHLLVTGGPVYQRAYGKALMGRQLQAQEISALSVGGSSGAEGGYAVPFQLDPTLIPTSNGAVNPYRQLARVIQVTTKAWEGVTASAVTAYRGNEGTQATDGSGTFTQPVVYPGRVTVFVPVTYELDQDWGALQSELAVLIQDAKDVEESSSFTTGAGTGTTNNAVPQGIVTGATVTVTSGATVTIASTDLDLLENDLPVRFRSRASWLANNSTINTFRHWDDAGGPDLWLTVAQGTQPGGNTGYRLHGKPLYECSDVETSLAQNKLPLIFGDFSKFVIVDRIGLSLKLIPDLFGANQLPTGESGFYAFWRNNSKVLVPNAFRVLKMK